MDANSTFADEHNLRVLDIRKPSDVALYDSLENINRSGGCFFHIATRCWGTNYVFESLGFFASSDDVTWRIIDGVPPAIGGVQQILKTQQGGRSFSYSLDGTEQLPLFVELQKPGCPTLKVLFKGGREEPISCENFDWDYEIIGHDIVTGYVIEFRVPCGLNVDWDFDSDGQIDFLSITNTFQWTFTEDEWGEYTICAKIDGCPDFVCKNVGYIGCGELYAFEKVENNQIYSFPSFARTVTCRIWLDNVMWKAVVGAKVNHYYRLEPGPYENEMADKITVGFQIGGTSAIGKLRTYQRKKNNLTKCLPHEQIFISNKFDVNSVNGEEPLPFGASMRREDAKCIFNITETVLFNGNSVTFFGSRTLQP